VQDSGRRLGEDRFQLRQVGGRRLDRRRLDPVTHQVGDQHGGRFQVASQFQQGRHVLPPRLPVALLELVPRVQRGQSRQRQRPGEVGQNQAHAVLVVRAPVTTRQLRPALQVHPALPGILNQLQRGRVERHCVPPLQELFLVLVQARQQGEGRPV